MATQDSPGLFLPREPKTILVLVGIGWYTPGTEEKSKGRPSYPPLHGAVPDVEGIEKYALKNRGPEEVKVFKLISPIRNELLTKSEIEEIERNLPTYANIVEMFDKVRQMTIKGDIVHIHFSCHGLRVQTNYPQLKGENAFDEAIAPVDIRNNGKCLRDIELGILIHKIVLRGAHVSVVTDCCHSSGITRGDNDEENHNANYRAVRAIEGPDFSVKSMATSLPQDDEELTVALNELWKSPAGKSNRETWLEAVGYDLFASCHLNRTAEEDRFAFDGLHHGLYTGTLLEILQGTQQTFTHDKLHRKIVALLRRDNRDQNPIFSGNKNRYFLQRDSQDEYQPRSISVIEVRNKCVHLSEGSIQGVTAGSTYAIYPWWHTDFSNLEKQPCVEITTVEESMAKAVWKGDRRPDYHVEVGCQAILVKYKHAKLQVRISPSIDRAHFKSLHNVCNDTDLVKIVHDDTDTADYHVGLASNGDFQVLDTNNEPLPWFPASGDAEQFVAYLSHLARYRGLRDLVNPTASKTMKDGSMVTLKSSESTWDTGSLASQPHITISPGKLSLIFRNNTQGTLYITVFVFNARWGAQQIYPDPMTGEDYGIVGKNEIQDMHFPAAFPKEGWPKNAEYTNYIKIFVVKKPMSFSSVSLQDIEKNFRGDDDEDFEENLADILADLGVPTRGLGPDTNARRTSWLTMKFQVHILRPSD